MLYYKFSYDFAIAMAIYECNEYTWFAVTSFFFTFNAVSIHFQFIHIFMFICDFNIQTRRKAVLLEGTYKHPHIVWSVEVVDLFSNFF